jgi:hypothetical protein
VTAVPAPDRRSPSSTLINLGLALVGGILLVVTVQRVGWSEVQGSIAGVGWWFVVVLALGGLRFAARARAWQVCAGDAGLRFPPALAATLAGDALGNLTPLGLIASEPAKVFFVADRVPAVAAVSSVAAENVFYMASVLVMLSAGAAVFVERAGLSPTLQLAAQSVLAFAVLAAAAGVWLARRRPAILSQLAHIVAMRTGRGVGTPERLREVEQRFYGVLGWPLSRLLRVVACEGLFHIAAVAEVFMVLRLLPAGRNVSLLDAFVLETAGRLVVVVFKFVPYRLGVDEAGTALVARALALDPALGVALALVRRVRILCWNGIGLALLARTK